MKKNTDKRNILDDRRVVIILSLVLGFVCWIIVAGFIDTSNGKTLPMVEIDYSAGEEDYKRNNLQIVTDLTDLRYAIVRVQGSTTVISGFGSKAVTVYPDYSPVTAPGTYTLDLKADKVTQASYNISEYSLYNDEFNLNNQIQTVTLTFEEVETKTFPITVLSDGVTAATGYFKDEPTLSTGEATVTGPTSEVAKVNRVVARVDVDEERSESLTYGAQLQMEDGEGEVIESDLLTIGPSETVEVTIPILETRTLALTVDIIGANQSFDMDWLMERVVLSTESVQVAGLSGSLTNIQDPYPVAEFDISVLDTGWESEEIEIELPTGVRVLDSAQHLTVSFDSTGLVKKTFDVTELTVRNTPRGTTVEPVPESVAVTLIGPAEQIDALLPENITIEVDAFSITASKGGQQTIPGRVVVPGANQVFAVGSYPIICDIEVS